MITDLLCICYSVAVVFRNWSSLIMHLLVDNSIHYFNV